MAQRVQSFQDAFNSVQKQLNDINQILPTPSSQPQMIIQAEAIQDATSSITDYTTAVYPIGPDGIAAKSGGAAGYYDYVSYSPYNIQQWTWGNLTWN